MVMDWVVVVLGAFIGYKQIMVMLQFSLGRKFNLEFRCLQCSLRRHHEFYCEYSKEWRTIARRHFSPWFRDVCSVTQFISGKSESERRVTFLNNQLWRKSVRERIGREHKLVHRGFVRFINRITVANSCEMLGSRRYRGKREIIHAFVEPSMFCNLNSTSSFIISKYIGCRALF